MWTRSPRRFSRLSKDWTHVANARPGIGAVAVFFPFFFLLFAPCLFADPFVEGRLDAIWGDPHPASGAPPVRLLTLTEDDGTVTELQVSEELLRVAGGFYAWNGQRVRAALRKPGEEIPGPTLRPGTRRALAITLLEDRSAGETTETTDVTGSHPWVSILCKFANVSAEPENLAYFQGMYANQPGGLDHYWREVSYGNINIVGSTAVDWVVLPRNHTFYVATPGGGSNANLNELFNDCTDAADPFVDFSNGGGGFSGINMMFNADLDCCAWGGGRFATLDGVSKVWRVTWEPPWGYAHAGVIAHEMGHGFGLPHANNWDSDSDPYDSPWDVMSRAAGSYAVLHPEYGRLGQHPNMHHKYQLGWVTGSRYLQVNDGQTVTATIDAAAVPGSPNYYMARLPIADSNDYYTVEVRKRMGNYDGDVPDDAVIIHHIDPDRSQPSWSFDAAVPPANFADNEGTMFRVGETFSVAGQDISVTIDSQTSNGFVVTINRGGEAPPFLFIGNFE